MYQDEQVKSELMKVLVFGEFRELRESVEEITRTGSTYELGLDADEMGFFGMEGIENDSTEDQ